MKYSDPFFHIQIDNFLSPTNFKLIEDFYNTKKFDLKHTDLFKFLQTDELAQENALDFFKTDLSNIFKEFTGLDETFYSIFASYYRKGDYLSCHDDMVEGRMYAFTFYLDDLNSGDLILFNKECVEEVKRISIKKNRLVIFEVSAVSFHEVEICKDEGRKAITGWLNKKGHILDFKESLVSFTLPSVEFVPFELNFESDNILIYEGMEYNFDSLSSHLEGKFVMRRVMSLILDTYVALDISGYTLVYFGCYAIDEESYILLNDFTNHLEGELLDVFIIESDGSQDNNIKLINEDGVLIHTLNILDKVMYVINRKNMKYFIERGLRVSYKLVHLIYKLN